MKESEKKYCSECVFYDDETEQGINGEMMATCLQYDCLVKKSNDACEMFI